MAASDPVPSVPTPTGALQGVAAFSWDGTTWQPPGAAYSSVATPTGVLRGVALFPSDGTNWQPFGRAQPGVPTPTGTLDGVALYTWSGTAWAPHNLNGIAGGPSAVAPDVPTPSGTLQGIAAFYFDGTAWQPSGQAAPEVATPFGVLAGMAMFSWNGAGWSPTVSGTAVDINFLNTTTLDARVTLTRASNGSYFDANGVMQTAAVNVPRFDHDPVTHASLGLLIEDTRTNLLLNSAVLTTQSVATTAQVYTLSFYGTGSVTLSGTATGTTNGAGVATRVAAAINPTAGTLTLTVAGSVTNAQLEAGALTSYIPTAGAAATRQLDVVGIASTAAWRNPANETFAVEYLRPAAPSVESGVQRILASLTTGVVPLFAETNLTVPGTYDGGPLLTTANTIVVGNVTKLAASWTNPTGQVCANGGLVASNGGFVNGYAGITQFGLLGTGSAGGGISGYMRRFRYWPRVLSNAEMQAVTT